MILAAIGFNWDVNLGSIAAALAVIVAIWQSRVATRKEQQDMHAENKAEIAGLKGQLNILLQWMQSQWGKKD